MPNTEQIILRLNRSTYFPTVPNDENGTLGIKLKDLNDTKDPTVYYTHKDTDDWFSELNYRGSEAFFFILESVKI